MKKGEGLLVGESDEDIRDNVLNYDEQGGGEEDEVRQHNTLQLAEASYLVTSPLLSYRHFILLLFSH